jgi:hypothetical protein
MDEEVLLAGGNSADVVRIGDTVRRVAGRGRHPYIDSCGCSEQQK